MATATLTRLDDVLSPSASGELLAAITGGPIGATGLARPAWLEPALDPVMGDYDEDDEDDDFFDDDTGDAEGDDAEEDDDFLDDEEEDDLDDDEDSDDDDDDL